MRSEIFTDFHELLQAYEWVFTDEIGGDHYDTWRVAATLIDRGDLSRVQVPTVVSCLEEQFKGPISCRHGSDDANDLCSIVGITYNTWKSFVNSCRKGGAKKDGQSFTKPEAFQKLLPQPIEGGSSYGGPFELKDVLNLRLNRELSIVDNKAGRTLTKHLFLPKSLLPLHNPDPFVPVLRVKIRELLAELSETKDAIFEHPEHLPRTNDDIYLAYRNVVARIVRRRLKYAIALEDAISETWVKLLASDILRKFLNSAPRNLPALITTDEAVEFLGVSWDAWCEMVDTFEGAPAPIKGSSKDPDAQFESNAILMLDMAGYFKQRHGLRRLPAGSVTLTRFENYLKAAAGNHMKNVLRTQDRRFNKESVQGAVVLSQTGDVFKRSVAVDENTAWEATLRAEEPLVEEVLDGYVIAQKLGVIYDSPEYYEKIADLAQGITDYGIKAEDITPESGLCLMTLMSEGHSINEAIRLQREFSLQSGITSRVRVAV